MTFPTANITYLGESAGSGSAADPPAANSKAKCVLYGRSEQYTDFNNVTFGGQTMTRPIIQTGGGAIEGCAGYYLQSPLYAEIANDNVAWDSSYSNNFKWGLDIMNEAGDVQYLGGGKETFTSWEVNRGPTVTMGDQDAIGIIFAQTRGSSNPSDFIVQDINSITPTLIYSATLDSQAVAIWKVPIAGGIGDVDLHVYPSWPMANGTVIGMVFEEVPLTPSGSFPVMFLGDYT